MYRLSKLLLHIFNYKNNKQQNLSNDQAVNNTDHVTLDQSEQSPALCGGKDCSIIALLCTLVCEAKRTR